ncbi:MAG: carboxypeptidase-like regulatory domain-containing protein, partial [bacterium]
MRVLNVLLVFLVLMLMPGVLFAGVTGKIAGVVKDKDTGDPLPGVNIVIEGTAMGAASDLNGEYFIINIPPGTYTVTASMVGYNSLTQRAVRVSVDLTTPLNFALEPTVIEFEAVTVTAERPMIQKDMTASTQVYSAEDIENVALDEVQETVTLTAGAVVAGGDMHIRGGREREVVYMIDGMQVEDPSFGGFDTDVPELSVGEISVVTGGFDAEYGSAQSGLVNLITKEGGAKFSGKLRYKTTLWDANSNYHFPNDPSPGGWYLWGVRMGDGEQLKDYEFSIGGPEPISTYLLPEIPGEVNFFFSGEVMSDRGRFPHQHSQPHTFQGKLTYEPSPNYKISLGGLVNWDDYEIFSNRWRRTTYEDLNDRYRNPDDPYYIQGWYGNGRLDTEDLNGNNVLDEGEDLNGNGVLDSEDLNYNGWIYDPQTNTRTWNPDALDAFSMLDHLPYYEDDTNNWNLSWTHTLSPATFYEVKFSRYMTKSLWQTRERMNEDRDGDGRLDAGEDLNHNGILDPGEDV